MTGIICALDCELENIASQMENKKTETASCFSFISGTINKNPAVAAVCGIGKVNAAVCVQTMILKYSPNLIINSGVAGGLCEALNCTDIAIAKDVAEHDFDTTPFGDPPGYITELNAVKIPCDSTAAQRLFEIASEHGIHCEQGTIASGDCFINGGEKAAFIKNTFGAIAAEMEGAAIGHTCALNKVPFCVLRSISDKADGQSHMDYNEFKHIAAKNAAEIITEFIGRL